MRTRLGAGLAAATAGLAVHAALTAGALALGVLERDHATPGELVLVAGAALVGSALAVAGGSVALGVATAWAVASLADHVVVGLQPAWDGAALSGVAHAAGDLVMHAPSLLAVIAARLRDGDAVGGDGFPDRGRRRHGVAPAASPEHGPEDRRRDDTARHER